MERKTNKLSTIIMIIVCLIGVFYSSYKIIFYKSSMDDNNTIIDEIKNDIEVIEVVEDNTDDNKYNINFENLKKQNKDTVGYLKVNNTNIDYVVVQSNDNLYYLSHNFKRKANSAGWIFVDYNNKLDGTDKNIVIYGHSMLNKTMFGSLHNVLKEEWYKNSKNYIIDFVTESGEYKYQVFSVYSIKVEDYYINTEFKSDEEFYKFIKTLKKRSKYDFNVSVSKNDKVLTLSTCGSGGNTRTVLHAKLVK